jgi:hypothetical protein
MYVTALNWSFALFNSSRLLSYLPTIWAIHANGNSSQHSLVTWLCWLGANASMAAWLYENNRRRFNKAVSINVGNALMCLATLAIIAWYR